MSQGISMNRRYDKHGWDHCNLPKHGNKQVIQQPIECISSDSQCLKFVTSARALVASCLNSIGRKVACFEKSQPAGLSEAPVAARKVCGAVDPFAKRISQRFGTAATVRHHAQGLFAVDFVAIQPGFLQLRLTQTWCGVYHWIPQGV